MCEGTNRSLANVLFGRFGEKVDNEEIEEVYEGNITPTSLEEVEMLLDTTQRVVIVQSYRMVIALECCLGRVHWYDSTVLTSFEHKYR